MANQLNLDTQIKGSRPPYFGTDSGAANAYAVATVSPLGPSLRTGSKIIFIAAHANTGASTLAVNGGSAIAIKKNVSAALASGDILAGQVVELVYDGTNWQAVTSSGANTSPVKIVSAVAGKPGASQIVAIFTADKATTFPANFSTPDSVASLKNNPAATAIYNVNVISGGVTTTKGTIQISTGGAFTFATTSGVSFTMAKNDRMEIIAPSSQDATLSDVGITLVGSQ